MYCIICGRKMAWLDENDVQHPLEHCPVCEPEHLLPPELRIEKPCEECESLDKET